ncbi:MAG: PDZ domain-containing protein, partial [Clostridia bacterium]|nr:PDZ domain-containing protein [Clostridia bacterium]
TVIEIANDLISLGYVSNRVRLGVQVSNYAPTSIFSTDDVKGVSVVSIMDDSPLKGTDVKEGDVITAINGESVTNIQSLFSEMGKYAPGDTVTLKIYRPASSSRKSTEFEAEVTFVADNGETQK